MRLDALNEDNKQKLGRRRKKHGGAVEDPGSVFFNSHTSNVFLRQKKNEKRKMKNEK